MIKVVAEFHSPKVYRIFWLLSYIGHTLRSAVYAAATPTNIFESSHPSSELEKLLRKNVKANYHFPEKKKFSLEESLSNFSTFLILDFDLFRHGIFTEKNLNSFCKTLHSK